VRAGEMEAQEPAEEGSLTWVKHDDGFSQNRKVAKLTDKAYRLHFCALEHCARNLTDGTIMDYEMGNVFAVAQIKRGGLSYVAELVDACLWKTIIHGYEIHEYLEHNPSAADVKEVRKRNAERQKKHREGKRHGVTNTVTDGVSNGVTNSVSHTAPSHPIPKEQRTSIATPVDNSREEHLTETLSYMDSIDFQGRPRLEALALGPTLMDEAIRRTRSRQDVDNPAAYFTTVTRNLLAVQKAWKSDMPLEDRLLVYVRNAGHEYDDFTLIDELGRKGADSELIDRLLVKADEIRREAA
jgi:hypothetical protein